MNDEIRTLQRDLIEGMTRYMDPESSGDAPESESVFDAGYAQAHVDRCNEILDSFLDALSQVQAGGGNQDAEIMEAVKTAVTELNALNEETEGCLIETDQREQLCEIIISSAREAGLAGDDCDITEEWREW